MLELNFFKSPEMLKKEITSIAYKISSDSSAIFPNWFNDTDGVVFEKHQLIVCGSVSREEIRALARTGNIVAIVDDELSKKLEWIFGIKLITTSEWIDLVSKRREIISLILVSTLNSTRHFIRQCVQHDFKFLTPIQILLAFQKYEIKTSSYGVLSHFGVNFFEYALKNVDALISQCDIFVDEYSKISYLNMILYKLTLNPIYLETIAVGRGALRLDYNNYCFDKSYLNFSDDEVYVDCGAFTGDTLQAFLVAVKGEFRHIYTFEPDLKNNLEIEKRIATLQQYYLKPLKGAISIIKKGVWSDERTLEFLTSADHDLGAHISQSGFHVNQEFSKSEVPVTSIDLATNQDATFIKYEVEGSELEALMGSIKTLERKKPKLMIAVYHKPEDILTLPKYINGLDLGYKIGFRQHDIFKPDATNIYCY
ncbi:FkbM family methyltransferase [Polynucleobacter sp. AP-Feld-500C-C5]|uniref:FkbM family methyltransferase n=1 Tax=Polynucleobacter sp. AP-Feld-500C-C5 TaxID=2576924 RepID=UPI001C0C3D3C|nr:FkbM family methyltransferase [Polynucleobacter sp. AP-Feld-500C-C5]MBU3633160.1 FkbM family methyltransferase [Polynucleobacter sp. AP-Feld-500C-C5]